MLIVFGQIKLIIICDLFLKNRNSFFRLCYIIEGSNLCSIFFGETDNFYKVISLESSDINGQWHYTRLYPIYTKDAL